MDAKPRKPYPSDPSDAQWALLELLWPPPVSAGAPRATPLSARSSMPSSLS
jgi:transposase